MKYNCNIIKDLLPSYTDNICSDESKKIIEEHFEECPSCLKLSEIMKDDSIENSLNKEKEDVLSKHNRHVKRKTYTIGIITSVILMLPVIVCLICNLAIGHALDWFFIVLTSMLLTASFIVVPLIAESKKLLWTILCSTVSLILLLLTCCIYAGGSWFFVAASSCIFGISVIFVPYIIRNIPFHKSITRHRNIIVFLWDSTWLYAILITCGLYGHHDILYWQMSFVISTYVLTGILLIISIITYAKTGKPVKAGLVIIIAGLWTGLANNAIHMLMPSIKCDGIENIDLSKGFSTIITDNAVYNANVYFTIIVTSFITGIILIGIGFILKHKNR